MTPGGAGKIHPLVKVLPGAVDPLRLFSALSAGGAADRALLLESADVHKRNAVRSLGCPAPLLKLEGRAGEWSLEALEPRGRKLLAAFTPALAEVSSIKSRTESLITGRMPAPRHGIEERLRLKEPGPMDLLRVLQGSFELVGGGGFPPGGLFGAFAYDFIDCFESLPGEQEDPDPVPDFHFCLADRLFQVDHQLNRTVIIATVFGDGDDPAGCVGYHEAQDWIRTCEEAVARAAELEPLPPRPKLRKQEVEVDLSDEAYERVVEEMKEHILAGDVFQIVPSRSFSAPLKEDPLTVYRRLRQLNPSPYMFLFRMGETTLLGASPETALHVSAPPERRVGIRPIAGTRPRGIRGSSIDQDLDSRHEADLKLDSKELAEHVMLVDLARNDIARVSKPATRRADALFEVEKYSHVQHLVSRISGELEDGLDPLHAYLATMNMGTLTGAPKVEAMRILRRAERTRRGFYGGAVGYYQFDGTFDTAIVIRSLTLAGDRAVARAGAGVVYDSIPANEAEETRHKARAPLTALGYRDVEVEA
ncbi:MAG: anthranilate synthase component 1 [bacterium]|nr:anthranilate synthase component 1 [bacterium]